MGPDPKALGISTTNQHAALQSSPAAAQPTTTARPAMLLATMLLGLSASNQRRRQRIRCQGGGLDGAHTAIRSSRLRASARWRGPTTTDCTAPHR